MKFISPYLKKSLATVAATATLLLVGCGGGGGDSPDSSTDNNANQPPTGNGTLNAGLTGKFWYKEEASTEYFTADARTGVEKKLLNAPTSNHYLTPSPNGKIFVFHSFDDDVTQLDLYDATKPFVKNQTLASYENSGYVVDLQYSPDSKYLGVLHGDGSYYDSTTKRGFRIFNISNPENSVLVRQADPVENPLYKYIGWLPNGNYIYKTDDNKLVTGDPRLANGNEKIIGEIKPPAGFSAPSDDIAISPDGTQIAMTFTWMEGPLRKSDVWITGIDGSNPQRLTEDKYSQRPTWSPDGKFIALKSDTDFTCTTVCTGTCNRWFVPSTARNMKLDPKLYLQIYKENSSRPSGLSCRRDIFWTQ